MLFSKIFFTAPEGDIHCSLSQLSIIRYGKQKIVNR